MAQTSQERTEQATPRRRQEGRRKGTVARSVDLNASIGLFAIAILLPLLGSQLVFGLLQSMNTGLSAKSTNFSLAEIGKHFLAVAEPMMGPLFAIAIIATTVGVMVGFSQVGFVLSAEPLNPNLNRLNPIEGIKRLLSRRSLFELTKTIVKLTIIATIAWSEISNHWDELLGLSSLLPTQALAYIGSFTIGILLKVSLAWIALSIIDYLFQRREVNKQLMMTKTELKQEMKEMETSPELRAEMIRRRRRLARARMMANVKLADVVVTNPTTFAVALKYDPAKMTSPAVVAKGKYLMADRIKQQAKKHRVPIVPNPPLARSLYEQVEVGDYIPATLYQAAAEVLAFVFKLKGKRL